MPEIPVALKPRLQSWWSMLDDGNHAIFEAIYLEAPAAVSRAISGGGWVADSAEPGLAAQLAVANDFVNPTDQIPAIVAPDPVEVRPYHAALGQKVEFSWVEKNMGSVAIGAYVTDVYLQNPAGETVTSARLTNAGLEAQATFQRNWEFEGTQEAGQYSLTVYMNAEGSDPGIGVAGPQGHRSATVAQFGVGSDEGQASVQDSQAWQSAVMAFQRASTSSPSEAAPHVLEGLNWLSSVELEDGERTHLQQVAERLASFTADYLESLDRDHEGNQSEAGQAFQAKLERLGGATNTSTSYAPAGRRPLLDALGAFAQ